MSIYLRGTIRIIEVGYWIATTCLEAIVDVQRARQVAMQCKSLLKAAETVWGPLNYEVVVPETILISFS